MKDEEVLDRINAELMGQRRGKLRGREIVFLCVAHDEKNPSASWNIDKMAWHCFSCGGKGGYVALAEKLGIPLTPDKPVEEENEGITLTRYADLKKLPIEKLKSFGFLDTRFRGKPAIRIAYLDECGEEYSIRYRLSWNHKKEKFRWEYNAKTGLYGLSRLKDYRSKYVILVEGESDSHTLWHHGIQALGLPGADMWKEEEMAEVLNAFSEVYLFVEPDSGGETLTSKLRKSQIAPKLKLIHPTGYKDPSELHIFDGENFLARFRSDFAAAKPPPKERNPNVFICEECTEVFGFEVKSECAEDVSWLRTSHETFIQSHTTPGHSQTREEREKVIQISDHLEPKDPMKKAVDLVMKVFPGTTILKQGE